MRTMTDDTVLDTTIRLPPTPAGEADMLLFALDRSRAQFAWKCGGLDAAGMTTTVGASTMTLGGLVKHLTLVEDDYFSGRLHGRKPTPPWDTVDWDADRDWEWHSAAEDTPEQLRRLYDEMVAASDRILREALVRPDAMESLSRRTFRSEPSRRHNLRWILLHLIEEYARHNGHADLLRESIDGSVGD
jgi:uncharacterized damage-inducible protein DinB